ncbi:GGDEF domain-containing protein [Uliginosibacterium aquaticum]|uniref:GGDEF domain-containing protein n=1 Tax=Uliginosibacterium aquaticum TaxID=2731212 RepID=A0ABX2IJ88_9RHOO|nr:GGDEF domain-containing protein [Uliginosibacterium aquaticum]NSL56898.1 GGDEF domain-containing protein [Uliginosibacterium aquaticum]
MRLLPFSRNFSTELILRLAIPLGALALGLMILLGVLAEKRERQVIGESLARAAARMAATLEANLAERVADVDLLASHGAWYRENDREGARRAFDVMRTRHPAFAWIGRTDAQGRVQAASDGFLQGESIATRPVFSEGKKGLFLGDVHEAVLLARLLGPPPDGEAALRFIDIARPVYDQHDNYVGVLATHLSWSWVRQFFGQMLTDFDRVRGVELLILNHENRVLAGPALQVGRMLALEGMAKPDGTGKAHWHEAAWPDEPRHLFAWIDMPPPDHLAALGWRVLVRQPSDRALSPVRQLRIQLAIAALLLTLGVIGLACIQARRITRPLARIAQAAEAITEGAEPRIPASDSHLSEVDSLSGALQHMLDTLTHREQALDDMQQLAHRDALTGLHNRRALELHMELSAERARRSGEGLAVLAMDLDGFKAVNDNHGHGIGDALLRDVARRLQEVVRSGEMLARLGGDEFVVLVVAPRAQLQQVGEAVAQRILGCFERPFMADVQALRVGCSLGGAQGAADDHPQDILRRADEALYIVKRSGRGRFQWWTGQA